MSVNNYADGNRTDTRPFGRKIAHEPQQCELFSTPGLRKLRTGGEGKPMHSRSGWVRNLTHWP